MRIKPSVVAGYLVLLITSLGLLALHYYCAAHARENTRTGVLPAHFPFWLWLGRLAFVFAIMGVAFPLLALRSERFARASTLLKLALVQLAFFIIYGVDFVFLVSHIISD